jgi:vacuolar-type H+-ATPase subunit H
MQEIVDEVLKTEDRASKIVAEAREKAAQIKSTTDLKTGESIKKAKEEAQHILLEEAAQAREAAHSEYKRAMEEVQQKNGNYLDANKAVFEKLADKIIELTKNPIFTKE